jgi:hypothetical protein
MIIVGSKETNIVHESLFNSKCSNCGSKGKMEMDIFSRYFHVFWIPVCPYQKYGVTRCNQCQQVLHQSQFSAVLLSEYKQMKVNAKKAYWQFTGAGLFILLMIAVFYSIKEDNKRDIMYLKVPQKDDIYEVYKADGNYTLYKVSEVTADSVYIILNKFESDKSIGLTQSKMNETDSYITGEYLPIAKKDLLKMKDKNEIKRVRRN